MIAWLTKSKGRMAAALALFVLAGLPLYHGLKKATWAFSPDLLPYNSRAPMLQGPTLAGGKFDSSVYGGRIRVYAFVDPTVAASGRQGAAIRAWQQTYATEPLVLVTVLVGGDEAQQRAYAERYELDPAKVVIDRGGVRADTFRVTAPPVVYLVDGQDRIRFAAAEVVGAEHDIFNKMLSTFMPSPNRRWRQGNE